MNPSQETAHVAAKNTFEYKGVEYTLTPHSLADLVELQDWLRLRPFRAIKEDVKDLPFELAKYVIDKAYAEGDEIKIGTKAFDNAVQIHGMPYLIYLSIHKKHPEVTLKIAGEMLTNDTEKQLTNSILSVAGYYDQTENPTQGQVTK